MAQGENSSLTVAIASLREQKYEVFSTNASLHQKVSDLEMESTRLQGDLAYTWELYQKVTTSNNAKSRFIDDLVARTEK